jgi:hypothetical protein
MSTQLQGRAAIGKTKVRSTYANSKTGICGVSEICTVFKGRMVHKFVVSPMRTGFNIKTLGREEALRRAVALRAKHEAAVKGAR